MYDVYYADAVQSENENNKKKERNGVTQIQSIFLKRFSLLISFFPSIREGKASAFMVFLGVTHIHICPLTTKTHTHICILENDIIHWFYCM